MVLQKSQNDDKLSRKVISSVITQNEKHSSKQVVPINIYWRKAFLSMPLLKVYGSFLFGQSKKVSAKLGSVRVFFRFLQVRR